MKTLENKVAVITGAGSGIGWSVALSVARQGAQTVCVDWNAEAGRAIAAESGGIFIRADLSQKSECQDLMREVLDRCGKVDILVNNAGIQHVCPIEEFPEEIWEKLIAILLTAPFLLTKYAWASMKAQRWGRIINVASVHGMVASPYKAAYVSAKHGVLGLTRTAALEGGPHGITVNAICPAYVRTALVESQLQAQAKTTGLSTEEVVQKVMLEPAAIKRMIEPEEIAETVAFLCSEAGRSVTGAAWTVDGGWTAR